MASKHKREKLPPFVIRVDRTANLRYERDVPPDLRGVLEKRRWRHSLETGVVREARIKAAALTHKYNQLIQRERARLRLGPEETARIAETGGAESFLEDVEERRRNVIDKRRDAEWMRSLAGLDGWVADTSDPFADAATELFKSTEEAAPRLDLARAEIAGLEASAAAVEETLARDAALVRKLHPSSEAAEALGGLRKAADAVTVRDVFDDWVKKRQPRSVDQYRTALKEFERLFGQLLIKQVDKVKIREFRGYLLNRCNKETTGHKYFKCLRGILRFASEEEHIDHNPAASVKWTWSKRSFAEIKDESRRTFTVDEIKRLLAACDALPKNDPRKQDVAWFVKLALWTGARPEEIAQLTPDDIGEEGGIRFVRIHDRGHRSVKNRASIRKVPIHRELIDRGLVEFVDGRRKQRLLFCSVRINKKGRHYPSIAKRVARLLRGAAGVTDGRVVFYSARHTMVDCLRLLQAPVYVEDRIMGHATPGRQVADGYGGAQLPALDPWMQDINLFDVSRTVSGFREEDD